MAYLIHFQKEVYKKAASNLTTSLLPKINNQFYYRLENFLKKEKDFFVDLFGIFYKEIVLLGGSYYQIIIKKTAC